MDWIWDYDSPLGRITLASDGERLTGLWFAGQRYEGAGLSAAHEKRPLPVLEEGACWLDCYFSGRAPTFTPPLLLRGTDFRRAVWRQLMAVPFGRTATYGDIAARLGLPRSAARAVGGAVGHNPVSLIVPCHRILGADGSLTGYAGGVERKRWLLEMEQGQVK